MQFFYINFVFQNNLGFLVSNVSCHVRGYMEMDADLIFPWVSENKDF